MYVKSSINIYFATKYQNIYQQYENIFQVPSLKSKISYQMETS